MLREKCGYTCCVCWWQANSARAMISYASVAPSIITNVLPSYHGSTYDVWLILNVSTRKNDRAFEKPAEDVCRDKKRKKKQTKKKRKRNFLLTSTVNVSSTLRTSDGYIKSSMVGTFPVLLIRTGVRGENNRTSITCINLSASPLTTTIIFYVVRRENKKINNIRFSFCST